MRERAKESRTVESALLRYPGWGKLDVCHGINCDHDATKRTSACGPFLRSTPLSDRTRHHHESHALATRSHWHHKRIKAEFSRAKACMIECKVNTLGKRRFSTMRQSAEGYQAFMSQNQCDLVYLAVEYEQMGRYTPISLAGNLGSLLSRPSDQPGRGCPSSDFFPWMFHDPIASFWSPRLSSCQQGRR